MKKYRNYIFISALLISLVPVIQKNEIIVDAKTNYTYYEMKCSGSNPYEVDTINDSGTFDNTGCYVDFDSAKTAMQAAGADAVVRHAGSYSANQIIAMTRGFVYSFGGRSSSSTVDIIQNTSSNPATTYVQNYRGMYYEDTLSYDGNGDGKVLVNAFGFEGYVSLKDVDFIPEKYFEDDLAIWVFGNDTRQNSISPMSVKPVSMYYTVVKNGNYLDLVFHGYDDRPQSDVNGAFASSYTGNLAVGPAADWMKEGDIYYSLDDVTFYSDHNFTQVAGTYYNYYLFQPLRTKSKITADQYNTYLTSQGYDSTSKLWDTGSVFLNAQNLYGINAAAVFAQACVESAYGTSDYAVNKNNLFGVGSYDDGPSTVDFTSKGGITGSINNQMGLLLRYYTDTDCVWFYGGYFGNKGSGITTKYASSATYGLTLASVYYRFDKIASGNNGNLTDWKSYSLGVIKDSSTYIYSDAALTNPMYATTYGYNTSYQKNHVVVILEDMGSSYKIQSTDYVSNGAQMHPANGSYETYDWNSMIGYISKSDVKDLLGASPQVSTASQEMYRLYNPNSGEHFYTMDSNERDQLVTVGWIYEGVGWKSPVYSSTPVYRLYNPNAGDHHYTVNWNEKEMLVAAGWIYEGIGWYSDDNQNVSVYRQYNPNAAAGAHNYTVNAYERDMLIAAGWSDEGVGWYGVN